MAIIHSGSNDEALLVDSFGAARITRYDSAGNCMDPQPVGSFTCQFTSQFQSASLPSTSIALSFYNDSAFRSVRIKSISLASYLGKGGSTGAITTSSTWQIHRFNSSSASQPSGGVFVYPAAKWPDCQGSSVKARFSISGSTISFGGIMDSAIIATYPMVASRLGVSSGLSVLTFGTVNEDGDYLELDAFEGIVVRPLAATAPIGSGFCGSIEWTEFDIT